MQMGMFYGGYPNPFLQQQYNQIYDARSAKSGLSKYA